MTGRLSAGLALVAVLLTSPGTTSADILRVRSLVGPANEQLQAGVAALRQNDMRAAEKAFTRALEIDPGSAGAHLGLAQVANVLGNHPNATTHFRRAIELAPTSSDVQALWGAYLHTQKKYAEAEVALKKAVSLEAVAVDPHVYLGDLYLTGMSRPKAAADEYREATKLDPKRTGAHYGLGLALQTLGDRAGAERALSEAVRLDPGSALAWMALGRLQADAGRYADALKALDSAIALHPTFAAAHIERGRVLAAQGDDVGALKAFEAAAAADPKMAAAQLEIGMLHQRRKRWAEAERAYRAAIDLDPNNAVAYNNAAWMWADRKVTAPTAVAWAQRATALAPEVPEFVVTLGWAYRATGDLPKALEQLQRASAKKPRDAGLAYRLGVVLVEMGRRQEGSASLKRALELNPSFPEAADAKRLLDELGAGR